MKSFIAEFVDASGNHYMSFSATNKAEAVDHANYCAAVRRARVSVKMVKSSEILPVKMGTVVRDINELFKEGIWSF